tara:strand:- start:3555 stop:3728 length:174 start_codon:yes stop_codon:yes gene_type:complete
MSMKMADKLKLVDKELVTKNYKISVEDFLKLADKVARLEDAVKYLIKKTRKLDNEEN